MLCLRKCYEFVSADSQKLQKDLDQEQLSVTVLMSSSGILDLSFEKLWICLVYILESVVIMPSISGFSCPLQLPLSYEAFRGS